MHRKSNDAAASETYFLALASVPPDRGEDEAPRFTRRLQRTLATVEVSRQPVRTHFGVALLPGEGEDAQVLVHLADQRLYHHGSPQSGAGRHSYVWVKLRTHGQDRLAEPVGLTPQ